MLQFVRSGVLSSAMLFALAGSSAIAGPDGGPSAPAFDVRVTFRPEVLNFDNTTPVFVLFSNLSVDGYSDPSNPLNRVEILSPNGDFYGHQEANGGGSQSGGYTDFSVLRDTINADGAWTMTITDGATRSVYSYQFSTQTGVLSQDYLRPITLTSPAAPGEISSTPTFEWAQDHAQDPAAEYTSASAVVTSPDYSNFHSADVGPDARSWTPNEVLTEGDYLFYVIANAYYPTDELVSASVPQPVGRGAPALNSFAVDAITGSEGIFNGFHVVPAPGTIGLVIGAAGMLVRRRRLS